MIYVSCTEYPGKKWWWPFFTNCIDLAISNAWMLHRMLENKPLSMLDFRREVCNGLLASYNCESAQSGPSGKKATEVRYTNKRHDLIRLSSGRRRCRECKSNTYFYCDGCSINGLVVGLHAKCSQKYHTK